MGKADPEMSRVYVRHVKYLTYYYARSRPFREQ
jgi:type IV secretory pathway TrbD component